MLPNEIVPLAATVTQLGPDTFENVSVTGYVLDPDEAHPTFVLTVALTF